MKSNPATLLLGIAVGAVVIGAIVAQKSSAAPVSPTPPPPPAPPVPPPPPASTGPTTATAPSPGTMKAADVASAWSSFIVVDMAKYGAIYNALPANAPLVAMGAAPVAQITAEDPQMATTVLGPLPTFIATQLAQGNRVWVGTPQLDPTASQPESVLPMYVGPTPPAGYTEVT